MNKCEICGSKMVPLLTSWVCPKECDKMISSISCTFKNLQSIEFIEFAVVPEWDDLINIRTRIEKEIIEAFCIPTELLGKEKENDRQEKS